MAVHMDTASEAGIVIGDVDLAPPSLPNQNIETLSYGL